MKRRQPPPAPATPPANENDWYAGVLSAEEWAQIRQWLETTPDALDAEVAVMRVLIRRVMDRLGGDDPARALPLVRQAMDSIGRALRAGRVLKGEATDSLSAALATALREVGEEMGLEQ